MVRTYTKIGDVFSAKTDENTKKYFQLIAYGGAHDVHVSSEQPHALEVL